MRRQTYDAPEEGRGEGSSNSNEGALHGTTAGGTAAAPSINARPDDDKRYSVVIRGDRKRVWSRYPTFEQAGQQAQALRKIGMNAHVVEQRGES